MVLELSHVLESPGGVFRPAENPPQAKNKTKTKGASGEGIRADVFLKSPQLNRMHSLGREALS